jgi:hypothetical protein
LDIGVDCGDDRDQIELMHHCCYADDIEMLKSLITYGFKFDICGSTILNICIDNERKNILEFILQNYPDLIRNYQPMADKEQINKYHFIKMLVDRELIDIPD